MCLNASIERQFEFIQKNWVNDTMVATLSDERDPIATHMPGGFFTIPQEKLPFRRRISRIQPYIKVVGGAYVFVPSCTGLRTILSLGK